MGSVRQPFSHIPLRWSGIWPILAQNRAYLDAVAAALHTPDALPEIIETLLQQGYTFILISQLILPGEYNVDYTIDHTGKQCAG